MELTGKSFLMFVDDIYEDLEVWYPKIRLIEAGATVVCAGPQAGATYTGKHGYPLVADAAIADMREADFTGLILPGGFAPDKLRRRDDVKSLTREFWENGKLVAHICHGGWMAASAGICRGVTMTSTPGIKDDLVNAGATWIDEPVVVDGHMISSRRPDDLPQFMKAILDFYAE
jgi:protease I